MGDVEAAFAQAAHVVKGHFTVQRYTGMPIETRGVMATMEPISGRYLVWSSTQWPHTVRTALAKSLGVPEHKVRVIAPDLGGGFGVKQDIYPEETVIPLVAERLGRPVRWIETRREHFVCTAHSREQDHEVELALDADGVVLGLRALVTADLGAYTRGLGVLCPSITAGSLLGPYRIKHYQATVRCALTNKAPAGAYRGAGGPEAVFALERTMDKAARELGIDPAEIRRRSFIQPGRVPLADGTRLGAGADHLRQRQVRGRAGPRAGAGGLPGLAREAGRRPRRGPVSRDRRGELRAAGRARAVRERRGPGGPERRGRGA